MRSCAHHHHLLCAVALIIIIIFFFVPPCSSSFLRCRAHHRFCTTGFIIFFPQSFLSSSSSSSLRRRAHHRFCTAALIIFIAPTGNYQLSLRRWATFKNHRTDRRFHLIIALTGDAINHHANGHIFTLIFYFVACATVFFFSQ